MCYNVHVGDYSYYTYLLYCIIYNLSYMQFNYIYIAAAKIYYPRESQEVTQRGKQEERGKTRRCQEAVMGKGACINLYLCCQEHRVLLRPIW